MTAENDKGLAPTVDAAIRIGLLGLLAYWSLKVVGPFLTVALWSAILTIALYPLFDWLARRIGSRRLAALLVTVLCLTIVVGPVTWLGFGLIDGVELAVRGLDSQMFFIPLDDGLLMQVRLGVLAASILAAAVAVLVLRWAARR